VDLVVRPIVSTNLGLEKDVEDLLVKIVGAIQFDKYDETIWRYSHLVGT